MEKILINASPDYDPDGNLVEAVSAGEFFADVAPIGDGVVDAPESGIADGNSKRLQLLTMNSPTINVGDEVVIRGEPYSVIYRPWDWGVGRRPVLRSHRPRIQIICERKEA